MSRADHRLFNDELSAPKALVAPERAVLIMAESSRHRAPAAYPTTAAGRRFEHDRHADSFGFSDQCFIGLILPSPLECRHIRFDHGYF